MPAIQSVDHAIEAFMALHRDAPLTDLFLTLTSLGDGRIITIVVLSLLFVLWRHKRYAYKAGLLVSLFASLAATNLIKVLVARPRPGYPFEVIHENGYSFPSSHAATSMATYGFLMYIVWTLMRPPHHRAPALALLTAIILFIGMSRVYLGVHYASDVVGGYVVGAFFVYCGILVTRTLSGRRGRGASKVRPSAR